MIISIDHRPIAPRILIVGGIRAKTMWQYLLDSRGTNDHFWSWKYIGIQGVECDQEDGVVPDLEGIIYERIVERKTTGYAPRRRLMYQTPVSVTGRT